MCLAKIQSGVALRTSSETKQGTGWLVNVQQRQPFGMETLDMLVRDVS